MPYGPIETVGQNAGLASKKPKLSGLSLKEPCFFCALIGMWHWMHRGKRSEVIGDRKTGFILLPEEGAAREG